MKRLLLVGALLVATPVCGAGTAPIICSVDQKFQCDREGCRPFFPGRIHNRIDPEHQTYSRCDEKGCDDYPASFARSGTFINIVFGGGTLAKLSDTRNDPIVPPRLQALHLLEVATTGLVVLVSYGTCSELEGGQP